VDQLERFADVSNGIVWLTISAYISQFARRSMFIVGLCGNRHRLWSLLR
jgi:hypothetical protein